MNLYKRRGAERSVFDLCGKQCRGCSVIRRAILSLIQLHKKLSLLHVSAVGSSYGNDLSSNPPNDLHFPVCPDGAGGLKEFDQVPSPCEACFYRKDYFSRCRVTGDSGRCLIGIEGIIGCLRGGEEHQPGG